MQAFWGARHVGFACFVVGFSCGLAHGGSARTKQTSRGVEQRLVSRSHQLTAVLLLDQTGRRRVEIAVDR